MNQDFSAKLHIVLKALVISRAGLAAALGVDKSLVGRWASGAVRPSEHNLARLTRYVAERTEGFTLFDWDRDLATFKALFGDKNSGEHGLITSWIPADMLDQAARAASQRGELYSGIWKSTRASEDLPGRFIHDICMVQKQADGPMRFRLGVEGVRYDGFSLILQNQIFSVAFDEQSDNVLFSIFHGVAREKPQILDGLSLATLRDAGGSPCASASVLERIADLTGDPARDDALFEKEVARLNPLAPEGAVSEDLARHLTRNVQSSTEGIVRLLFKHSMARGATLEEVAAGKR